MSSYLLPGHPSSLNTASTVNCPQPVSGIRGSATGNPATLVAQAVAAPATVIQRSTGQQTVEILKHRLEQNLPCNSGRSLIAVESDPVAEEAVHGFIKLVDADISVPTLSSMLGKLRSRALPDGSFPEQVLDSVLYILKIITRVLSARLPSDSVAPTSSTAALATRHMASASTPFLPSQQSELQQRSYISNIHAHPSIASFRNIVTTSASSWHQPGPLDKDTVKYVFDVLEDTLRHVTDLLEKPEMFPWEALNWEPALSSSSVCLPRHPLARVGENHSLDRLHNGRSHLTRDPIDDGQSHLTVDPVSNGQSRFASVGDSGKSDMDPQGSSHTRSPAILDNEGRCRYTIYAHNFTRDVELHGSYLASVPVLIRRYTARIIHSLSALSWPLVLSIVKNGLTTVGPHKYASLKIVESCVMDRTRLISILQVYIMILHDAKFETLVKIGSALRIVILRWVENFPDEFEELWAGYTTSRGDVGQGHRRDLLNGTPERLFDIMLQQSKENNRRGAILYPALTVLICICPDRFHTEMNTTKQQSWSLFPKPNLLRQLQQALKSGPNIADYAAIAYTDLLRLSFSIRPSSVGEDEIIIRIVSADKANDLREYLLQPPNSRVPFYTSTGPIDVNFYAYCIAAIYRFQPKASLQLMDVCLAPGRSYAVKQCVMKALILLTVEATKYPWQPHLDILLPVITPRLRDILRSCMFDIPEVVNGQAYVPDSHLAEAEGANVIMTNIINERARLLVQIQTIRSLEPSFWLYGASHADYACLPIVDYRKLDADRDRCERVASMIAQGAILTCALHISPAEKYYKEAREYIYFCAPYCFMSAARMVIHSPDDRDMQRLGIISLQAMLQYLAYGSQYDDDDASPWRFSPTMRNMVNYVELAIWMSLPSALTEISAIGQECLRLLNIWECNPLVPQPTHMSERYFSMRCVLIKTLNDTQGVIEGRQAFQKRLRKRMNLLLYLSPPHLLATKAAMLRLDILRIRMEQLAADQISTYNRHEDFHEWQNILYAMAAGASTRIKSSDEDFPKEFNSLLPPYREFQAHDPKGIRKFISDTIGLLTCNNIHARESAKEALANELNTAAMPILFKLLDEAMQKRMATKLVFDSSADQVIFVEQVLLVLKIVIERLNEDMVISDSRVTENCLAIARFIKDRVAGDVQSRLKIRYCTTISVLLSKLHRFQIGDENEFRSKLCDILGVWIERDKCITTASSHFPRLVQEARIATIKLLVLGVETLTVSSNVSLASQRTLPVTSQKMNHYITILLSILNEPASSISSPTPRMPSVSKQTSNDAAIVDELAMRGILYILKNNIEACKELCVSKCYDADPNICNVCMQVFTRALEFGITFDDQPQTIVSNDQQNPICQLLRDSETLILSVLQQCPTNQVENMVPVFIRLFDTTDALLNFLRIIINQEVRQTDRLSNLLRSNDICTRIISTVAQQHGYDYLRSNVEFLVKNLARTTEYSYVIDLAKTSPEDAIRNAGILVKNAEAFMGELFRTIDKVPYVLRKISCYIVEAASKKWPESGYLALGAFLFFRIIGSNIASPDSSLNIVVGDDRQRIRRGLLVVAKILQSLSKQTGFGQDPVVKAINEFIQNNVQTMMDYLTRIQAVPSERPQDAHGNLYTSCDDTDAFMIHKFVQAHHDRIKLSLLTMKELDNPQVAKPEGVWGDLCNVLLATKMALKLPELTPSDQWHHTAYQDFMARNEKRTTTALAEACTLHVGTKASVFVLTLSRINTDVVDLELLLFLIFKTLSHHKVQRSWFDVVLDFSAFTHRSLWPIVWLKLAIELLPADIRNRWKTTYLFSLSSVGQSFCRKLSASFSGLNIVNQVIIVSSIEKLRQYLPHATSLLSTSISVTFQYDSAAKFDDVHFQIGNQSWSLGTVHVGLECIRVASINRRVNITDFIHFRDVDDVCKSACQKFIILQHAHKDLCLKLEISTPESLLKVIQEAKQKYTRSNMSILPAVRGSSTSARLLAIGLFHAHSKSMTVLYTACKLLEVKCAYLGFEFDHPSKLSTGIHSPSHFCHVVLPFVERISAFAPEMTLDFILEWAGIYSRATHLTRLIGLEYLTYWIRFLERFNDASDGLYNKEKLRRCIHVLVNIAVQHSDNVSSMAFKQYIWSRVANYCPSMPVFVQNELIPMAISFGPESERCRIVAEIVATLSTVTTRQKLLKKLRSRIAEACSKPTKTIMNASESDAVCVLSHICMVSMGPRTACNLLLAPGICHIVCMLAGIGPFAMRHTIYLLTMNFLNAWYRAWIEDEATASQIQTIVARMSGPEYLRWFGLDPTGSRCLLELTTDEISIDALEGITKLFKQAMNVCSSAVGLSNTWRARWMSFLSTTTFQPAPYAQYRGFTILGCLVDADDEIGDGLVRQMLHVLQRNISQPDGNAHVLEALIRCMRRLVPASRRGSKYLPSLFWLAISLHQADHLPLRGEATQLLQACIETMDKHGCFNVDSPNGQNVVAVLMNARKPLSVALERLDNLSEICFGLDFGFALITALWYDVQNSDEITLIKEALVSLLRVVIKTSNPAREKRQRLDSLAMPLFLGLAPCFDRIAYKQFLEDECHVFGPSGIPSRQEDLNEDNGVYLIDVPTLGISDARSALLAVGFLTCTGDSKVLSRKAQENIHLLWGAFAKSYPAELTAGMWHNMEMIPATPLAEKIGTISKTSKSTAHSVAVSTVFDLVMASPHAGSRSAPDGRLNASTSTLGLKSTQTQCYNGGQDESPTDIYQDNFIQWGMRGILEPFRRVNERQDTLPHHNGNPERTKPVFSALADLVESLLLHDDILI